MEIIDSKKTYKSPLAKVAEINVKSLLCLSDPDGTPRYREEDLEPGIFG